MHATIHLFTYKTGLLARVAHDLRLTVERHELSLQGRHIRGFCAADTLRVDGVMTAQGLDPRVLSDTDKRQINETVRSEILQSARYPRIELEGELSGTGEGTSWLVRGLLSVRGQSRPLTAPLVWNGDQLQVAFELVPTEFGIAPYKALAGAIKLQDRVRVTVDIALEGRKLDDLLASTENLKISPATPS